jgi:hypothetical protein
MTISNDNPTAFSISSTNPALTTLTFVAGATNVQSFNIQVSGAGAATLTVLSNSTVNGTTFAVASQVSAEESFAYQAMTDGLPGLQGGTGFDINAWTGFGSVVSPGLSYVDLESSSNAVIVTVGGGLTAERTFYTPGGNYGGAGGGTVWISFLAQGEFPTDAQHYAWVILLNGTAEPFRMGLSTGEPNNGKWGFGSAGAGSNLGYENSVTPSTNPDLLVYRLDFPSVAGGLVNVTFYADPPVAPQPPATPTGTGSAFYFVFNGIRISTDIPITFDEIRVGGSWAEVVPSTIVPPAELSVQRVAGNQIQISWPATAAGELYSSTNLTGPWGPSGLSITTEGGQKVATDALGGTAKFYRLQ